jgi:hypothetical protein
VDLLAVLEEKESRHSADAELSRNIRALVDIELDEVDVGVLVAPGMDLGRDGLAGTAPLGEGVDDDQLAAGDGLGELGFAIDLLVSYFTGCGLDGGGGGTYLATCLTTIVTGEARNLFSGEDEKAREDAGAETARRRRDEARVIGL